MHLFYFFLLIGIAQGFYESGYQPSNFGRNILGSDDHGKPSSSHQPNPSTHTLSSGGQTGTSATSQTQSGGGLHQGYQAQPPPVPYYYPNPYYSQPNPYYNGPNPNYGIGQPFMNVKYPPVYQGPGPATPTSASGKAGSQAVPPQPSSYGHSGLYGGPHHPGGYDDMNYGNAPHQHHQQHQATQPTTTSEYNKQPLYGLNQQGFLSQQTRHASGGSNNPHAPSHPSPENTFKYAGQPGTNVGVGAKGPSETATRGQPIYGGAGSGASRFNGPAGLGGGVVPQGGQGQGNYTQSGGESNYYPQYQRPQFWH